jgi:antitoxin (DNA-binding transcriptional repressor) of toxin-antitoxin stability system
MPSRYNGPMSAVSIEENQRDPLDCTVEAGKTLVITRAGQPVAEMKLVGTGHVEPRPFGLCAGELIVPDDFDDPLPEGLLGQFEGQ